MAESLKDPPAKVRSTTQHHRTARRNLSNRIHRPAPRLGLGLLLDASQWDQ
ncbi:hypothetical protein ACIQU5_34670 [Streptomyces sp. NPDC090306]|uniref:hypothetical protein n=1 Tax=Streptomyces sp. NPDC090306 TaxID=3365961 RepID=UPI003803A47D